MNHGFVFTPGRVTPERLDKLLREIVRERWGDLVKVEREGEANHWNISWGTDYSFGLGVWIETARKIEMRKQLGDMSSWLQTFIQESLAARLKGKCAGEGTGSRRWAGKPKDWLTYRQWWEEMNLNTYARKPDAAERRFMDRIYNRTTSRYPKELLCTADSIPVHASRPSSPKSSRKTGPPKRKSSGAGASRGAS